MSDQELRDLARKYWLASDWERRCCSAFYQEVRRPWSEASSERRMECAKVRDAAMTEREATEAALLDAAYELGKRLCGGKDP